MISGVSSRLFQPYIFSATGPIRAEVPESFPFLKLPDIPSRHYADLRNHPDFVAVKAQFLRDIDEMDRLARGFVGNSYIGNIDIFRKNIDEPPENIEGGLFAIFDETRHQIHKIVARMKALSCEEPARSADKTSERDRITLALHLCLNEIDQCPAGVQSRFSLACRRLEAEQEQLDARLFLIRKSLLEEFSHTFLRQAVWGGLMNIQPGDEIHWVNALFNAVCGQFGVDTIADPMATRQIRPDIMDRFCSELPRVLSEYTVLHTLSCDYYQRFCHFLDKKSLSHWRTEKIPPGKLTSDHMDDLEQAILNPLNQLCNMQEREKTIKLATLIEDDGDQYSFARCREKIQGWLTRTIMEAPATLFARIPGPPDRPQRCIGTCHNLFFWVFDSNCPQAYPLEKIAVHPFDAEGSRALTISDLSTIDVCSWPEPVQLALVGQAVEQTGVTPEDALNLTAFLLGTASGRAVESYPENVQKIVASQLTEKMAASPDFAAELTTAFCQSLTGAIPGWLVATPLLEPLLVTQRMKGKDVSTITDNLNLWQLMTFSPSSLNSLYTPDECQRLFQLALNQELGGLMWRLLQTGHCDAMNNHANPETTSVLMVLCEHGNTDGVAYLLDAVPNTDINSKNTSGWTALHIAARDGHADCLNRLLAKSDIALNEKTSDGWTALQLAARFGRTRCLHKLLTMDNIALNERDNNGLTALHYAAGTGRAECLKELLAMDNIDLNVTNNIGWTALHLAAWFDHTECLKQLLAMDNIALNAKDDMSWTALHLAAFHGHPECLDKLLARNDIALNAQNRDGWTALQLTVRHNRTTCLKKLLAMDNIALNSKDSDGLTVLHFAAGNGHTACLEMLLAMGNRITLNGRSNNGWTALHFAAYYGYKECLNRLLTKDNIALNEKNDNGWTALHLAVRMGRTECLKELLSMAGTAVNDTGFGGFTALHCAAGFGYTGCLQELLAMDGIAVNETDNYGCTALHFAAKHGHAECLQKLLLMPAISVNVKARLGFTALMAAAENGHIRCVELLLKHGDTELNITTRDGIDALTLARFRQHQDIVDMLENASRHARGSGSCILF